jgi:hypothetical protein
MTETATLAPEMIELLRAGADHTLGIVCRPGQVRKLWPLITEAERHGWIRLLDVEKPWITDAGRKAIGAPSQAEASHAKLVEECKRCKPVLRASADPRTDFDYRSYQANDFVCVLAVKQPDARVEPATIRVGRDLSSAPQFLGPKNSIVQPESEGSFVLAVMPHWIVRKALLPTYPFALNEDEPWTENERALWDRLRNVCISVNTRIRRGGSHPTPTKNPYGANA